MAGNTLEGKRLGAYAIQTVLGQGGMAQVYKAYHERLQREVAIKVIQPDRAGLADFRVSFEQEARLIARLQHPNIVTVYDFGQQEDLLYLVMQYVSGGTLRDQIKGGPLEPRRAALYILQMARALHHAHQHDIVHRDVKPLNMLVSANNRNNVLLSDFGLAEIFAGRTETHFVTGTSANRDEQALSHIGDNIVGTPRYMAPEQCLGKPIDARTDIYALGVVLFELLTGQPPFRGETLYSLMRMHVYQPVPSIQEINPAAPELLAKIIARAMQKAPEDRFQSAKEVGLLLERFLAASPANITTPATTIAASVQASPLPAITQPRKKRKLLPYSIVLALFVLLTSAQLFVSRGYLHLPGPFSGSSPAASAADYGGCTSNPAAQSALPFSENFQDNRRNWPLVGENGITTNISNNTYTLSIASSKSSFFLCPDATGLGKLPTNFSLTAHMAQSQGSPDTYYGLAFHLTYKNGSDKVSGYAFEINGQGECVALKYDPQEPNGYMLLKSVSNVSAIHTTGYNILRVVVRGSQFSFTVNNTPVLLNGPGQANQSMSDSSYAGGQPGLIISGPKTRFVVSSMTLAIP